MQSKWEEHPNFKLKYEDNLIETVEATETLTHDHLRSQ